MTNTCFVFPIDYLTSIFWGENNKKKLGFSHPKSYAKCYVYGKVIHKFEKNNSNWIELVVKDNFDFIVKLQYSKKMRVSDINYDVGDNLFIYALIISSEKKINKSVYTSIS